MVEVEAAQAGQPQGRHLSGDDRRERAQPFRHAGCEQQLRPRAA